MKSVKHFQNKFLIYKIKELIKHLKLAVLHQVGLDLTIFLILLIVQVKKNLNLSFLRILNKQKE
jgi:hypothetical protein